MYVFKAIDKPLYMDVCVAKQNMHVHVCIAFGYVNNLVIMLSIRT